MSPVTTIPNRRTFPSGKMQRFVDACIPPLRTPANPPWRLLLHLLLLAFVLRAALALSGDFILHPDEIMQYLEPAHALVFGSGILHWEYYYGARSWLVPGFIAAILFLCKMLGLGEPAYYIPAVKLTLCALSLLIPLCMYHLGRRLFGETTARTALLLGVFWYELVGFAHKPMTEFIATALFLLLLIMVLRPRLTPTQAATASAFAVLVVAVRFQYTPLVGLVWLIPFLRGCTRARLLMLAAAAAAVCAVGLFDKLTWGEFLQSYRINYYFNVAFDKYRASFEYTTWLYVVWLGIASGGLALAALAGVFASRQRVFLLLLMLAALLPHEMQVHREYRFLFVLVPLWLLLCADVLCAGWRSKHTAGNGRWRQQLLLGWAVLASAAGIANALPWQQRVYNDADVNPDVLTNYQHYGRFLRNRDKTFPLCRRLAADSSVRGVLDARNQHHLTCGYYTLHRKVPLYDRNLFGMTDIEIKNYVSHIITTPRTTVQRMERHADGSWVLFSIDGRSFKLPFYISDEAHSQLVLWDKSGRPIVIEGFSIAEANSQFTLWKADNVVPVRTWTNYRVHLSNEDRYRVLKQILSDTKEPQKFPVKFVDEAAAR